jgi:hypothetical protein
LLLRVRTIPFGAGEIVFATLSRESADHDGFFDLLTMAERFLE